MTDAQILQVFGVAYLAIGLGMLFNPSLYKKVIEGFIQNDAVLYVAAIFAYVVGMLIVLFHNTWGWQWSMVITIIGWAALIKGISLFIFPKIYGFVAKGIAKNKAIIAFYAILVVLIGMGCTYLGFLVV